MDQHQNIYIFTKIFRINQKISFDESSQHFSTFLFNKQGVEDEMFRNGTWVLDGWFVIINN